MGPDERAIAADLASEAFLEGVDRGWWTLRSRTGTIVVFDVHVPGREVTIRSDFLGYPGQPPTSQLWDAARELPLAVGRWPQGGRASEVFSTGWSPPNGGAFYFPYDRRAVIGHEVWRSQSPGHVWTPQRTVVDLLLMVRDVLRSATSPERDEDAA